MMEESRESRGGIYLTKDVMAPHGEEPVETMVNDHGGKEGVANKENQGNDDPMEGKGDRMSEFDPGALERDLLEYDFNETEGGGANETLVLVTPSSFMSPTKEPPASLSFVESLSLFEAHQRRGEYNPSVNTHEGGGSMIRREKRSWPRC